jgi:hypothetical protein
MLVPAVGFVAKTHDEDEVKKTSTTDKGGIQGTCNPPFSTQAPTVIKTPSSFSIPDASIVVP